MNASMCDSAAPPYAIRIWADERSIFAELPSINGPYVAEFARSEGGLSQALHILGAMHATEHAGEQYLRPEAPVLPSKRLAKDNVTKQDLDSAREVLKKLGVI